MKQLYSIIFTDNYKVITYCGSDKIDETSQRLLESYSKYYKIQLQIISIVDMETCKNVFASTKKNKYYCMIS